jgi:hypothetical protein
MKNLSEIELWALCIFAPAAALMGLIELILFVTM